MNRKLTALCIAAALAAPALASAADDRPSVQVYGRLHLSLERQSNGVTSDTVVASNNSRLGVKGNQALDDGLKAIYQLELKYTADNKGGTLDTRDTFLGLQHTAAGTLRVGRITSPLDGIRASADLFSDQIGDLRSVTDAGLAFGDRYSNAFSYTSPKLGGVVVDLYHSVDRADAEVGNTGTSQSAISANYKGETFYVGLGYERAGTSTGDEPSAIRLGSYVDLGDFRLTGFLQQAKDVSVAYGDTTAYGLGGRYKMGKFAVKAQAARVNADGNGRDATLMAAGAEYALAKNLTTYLVYGAVNNDTNSNRIPYTAAHSDRLGGVNDQNSKGIGLGAVYNF